MTLNPNRTLDRAELDSIGRYILTQEGYSLIGSLSDDGIATIYRWSLDFAIDCDWADVTAEDIASLAPWRVVRACGRHYAGGLVALCSDAMRELAIH